MSFVPQTCWRHSQRSGRSKSDLEVHFWPIYILTCGRSKSGDKELIPKNFRLLPTQSFQLNRLMFTNDLAITYVFAYRCGSKWGKSGDKELIPKNFRLLPTQSFQLNRLMFTNDLAITYVFAYRCGSKWGFPGGSDGQESACNAGDPGSKFHGKFLGSLRTKIILSSDWASPAFFSGTAWISFKWSPILGHSQARSFLEITPG